MKELFAAVPATGMWVEPFVAWARAGLGGDHHISTTAGVESYCKMQSGYTSFGELRDGTMAVQLGCADNRELRESLG